MPRLCVCVRLVCSASTSAIEAEMEDRVTQLVETLTAELRSTTLAHHLDDSSQMLAFTHCRAPPLTDG